MKSSCRRESRLATGRLKIAKRTLVAVAFLVAFFFGSQTATWSQSSLPLREGSTNRAGLWFDIAPMVDATNRPALTSSSVVNADDLAWVFSRPAILALGAQLRAGPLRAVMTGEMQQDSGELLLGGSITNLLVSQDWKHFYFSNNYPNVGFLEGESEHWHFSLGRRALNLGPGAFSLTVSGQNPWYDHILAGLSAPLRSGELGYDFLAINVQNRANNGKYLFMHRLQTEYGSWSAGISEYNLVTKTPLDFQDIGPFIVYHHLFSAGSNVMAQVDFQYQPSSNLRVYAEALMDDFQLSSESAESNPNAFGFHGGVEWAIRTDAPSERPPFFRKDYSKQIGFLPLKGSLVASLEWYWASTYLYRRISSDINGAYYSRYFLQTQNLGWQVVEPWFSYPLGPDRMVVLTNLRYSGERLEVSFRGSFALLGAQSGSVSYDPPYALNWLGPQAPWTYRASARLSANYLLKERLLLISTVLADWTTGSTPVFSASLGIIARFGLGDMR